MILKEWISQCDKLDLGEAKDFCNIAFEINDDIKRKEYLDKVILGTLFVVYEYINRNELFLFETGSYDENDIISSFVEVWVKKIYAGELLNVNRYSDILNRTFLSEVYQNLVGIDTLVSEIFGMTKEDFVILFYVFIQLKNKGYSFNFDDLINYISKDDLNHWDLISRYNSRIMIIFENIYNSLNINKDKDWDLPVTKINNLVKVLIEMGITESLSSDLVFDMDMEQSVVDKMTFETFSKDIDEILENDMQKQIIHDMYGLDDGDFKSLDEISKTYNISKGRIKQIEVKSLRLLRCSKKTINNYI